ncbi:lysine-specific demethylase 6B-like [Alosa sapidissima]|uniref:lysine-specific demethylase 6B-like n=1 Tax=Alosa sapidissima TaxID=34773 RepID=UPI001C0869C3|nr:lysine-specific demethylase 6B-like [Alosa sapidissima]
MKMANKLQGKGRVKPNHPPPPPPVPSPQSLTREQVERADQTQPDEKLYKNTENPEEAQPGPAEDLYMIPDDEPLYSNPNELTPPVSRRPKPVRPPPPSKIALRRWASEGTGASAYKEAELRPPLRPPLRPGASVYKEAELRPPLMRQTETETDSEQLRPDGPLETTQPDGPLETTQPAQSDPQVVSPALPPEERHSSKVLTRQGSMEDLKEEAQVDPLYIDVMEEPLYIDPDELNLPIKGKPKPFRPPPPSSASVRYSPSPGHSPSNGSSPSHGPSSSRGSSSPLGSSPAPDWYKARVLQRGQSGPGDRHTPKVPSPKLSLYPQLSLPSQLPTARSPQQSLHNSKKELDMLMEWWCTAKCWENMYRSDIDHQVQEQNKQTLFSEAQRVRLALNLFECLLFHRGQIFNSHITQLYGLADKLDETKKKAKVAGIAGGSVAAATGIVLAPFTLGLSLTATAIGVGVAVSGAKGGSSTITDKWYSSQERKKVEEILQEHKVQMEDVEGCLQFINAGTERLRKFEPATVQDVDEEVVKMTRVAQILGKSLGETQPAASPTKALQGFAASMDIYFQEQEKLKKKGSETKLARKVRELAKQMKSGLDELMLVRNRIRAAVEQAETQEQR